MLPPDPLYDFQMSLNVMEEKKGVKQKNSYFTEIEKFAVFGGLKRTITKYGIELIGDADIMAEFYQAKQFKNLIITIPLDVVSLVFQRIYDRKLSFEFTLTVRSLEPTSRFRILQLAADKARIVKPPATNDEGDTLNITYANPQVFYWYADKAAVVKEKI